MADRSASLTRSTMMLTAVGLVAQLLSFLYRVVLSRLVGAEIMGLYQLIMPVYSIFLSIAVTGLTVAVSSLSAHYEALEDRPSVRQLLWLGLRGLVALWLPLAAVTLLFSGQISGLLLGDSRTRLGLVLLLPVLLLTGVENLTKHHFYGIGEVRLPAAVELGEQFVRTAAVLGLVWCLLPEDPAVAVALIVLGMLASEVFSSSSLTILRRRRERRLPAQTLSGRPAPGLGREMVRVAVPVGLTALLGNLMASANSVLIPRKLAAAGLTQAAAMEEFGVVFGMTGPMLNLPSAFISALTLAIVPRLSQCQAMHRGRECREKISKAILAASVIVLPVTALMVTLGPDLGQLLFQNEGVGGYILPLSVGVVLNSYESVLAAILNGIGRQSQSAAVSLGCGGIQLLCTFLGNGLTGFLFGLILSSLLGVALRLGLIVRHTGLHLNLFQSFSAPALGALLAGLCVRLLYRTLADCPVLVSLTACAGAGLFLYFTALWMMDVHPLRLFHLVRR
ncbi:MAG: oligosaccharide flippase family protein [Clostridiales bacterium]|nr:oligosaccharide flippase family protein [Clostridiales bacterium]